MPLHRGDRNRALLVSVAQFDYGVSLSRRPGVSKDEKKLHKTLSKLGFKVDIHRDLSCEEIHQLFMEESQQPVKDCFLAVLSSHGSEGCIFGADGKPVRLSHIFNYFDNKCMENKAKLFFIQACRGDGLDVGVEVDSVDAAQETFSPDPSVPIDTAVVYATPPGYAAFSHPQGSVFLQTLVTMLEENGNRNLELTRLMTRLCHRVAYTFQAKEAGKDTGALGLATSALIDTEYTRKRIPSIS
ncbi:unnamed protein product [Knipowitschia caucasica]|uniref:Caspase family p20 domain-containing protein n=1 Tax=Knipowitschia caucasica TaxID=637954 RepID=A0AAV2IU29_KNICA